MDSLPRDQQDVEKINPWLLTNELRKFHQKFSPDWWKVSFSLSFSSSTSQTWKVCELLKPNRLHFFRVRTTNCCGFFLQCPPNSPAARLETTGKCIKDQGPRIECLLRLEKPIASAASIQYLSHSNIHTSKKLRREEKKKDNKTIDIQKATLFQKPLLETIC